MLLQFTLVTAFGNLDSSLTWPHPPLRCLPIDFSASVVSVSGLKVLWLAFLCHWGIAAYVTTSVRMLFPSFFIHAMRGKSFTKRIIMDTIVDAWRSTDNVPFCGRTMHGSPEKHGSFQRLSMGTSWELAMCVYMGIGFFPVIYFCISHDWNLVYKRTILLDLLVCT